MKKIRLAFSNKKTVYAVLLGLVVLGVLVTVLSVQKGSFTLKRKAVTNHVFLTPQGTNHALNEEFTVYLAIDAGPSQRVYGSDIAFTYNSVLQITNIVYETNYQNPLGTVPVFGNGSARILGAYTNSTTLPNSGTVQVARITFKGISDGAGTVTFTEGSNKLVTVDTTGNTINVNLTGDPASYTIGQTAETPTPTPTVPTGTTITPTPTFTTRPTDTPTPTPAGTLTPTPTIGTGVTNTPTPTSPIAGTPTPTLTIPPGTPILNISLKFQGIAVKAPDQKIRVKVVGGPLGLSTSKSISDVVITSDSQGVWTGSVPLVGVPAGSGYQILVKGPMHMQRKFCTLTPSVSSEGDEYTCASGQSLALTSGANTLNLSGVLLYVGDLPPQDGVMNIRDAAQLRLNLGKTDAESLRLSDVNFDGIVNTTDYSLVLESMQTDFDEE